MEHGDDGVFNHSKPVFKIVFVDFRQRAMSQSVSRLFYQLKSRAVGSDFSHKMGEEGYVDVVENRNFYVAVDFLQNCKSCQNKLSDLMLFMKLLK